MPVSGQGHENRKTSFSNTLDQHLRSILGSLDQSLIHLCCLLFLAVFPLKQIGRKVEKSKEQLSGWPSVWGLGPKPDPMDLVQVL